MAAATFILPEEKALFARIAMGDEKAFTEIFHHYNRRIYPFILKNDKIRTAGRRDRPGCISEIME